MSKKHPNSFYQFDKGGSKWSIEQHWYAKGKAYSTYVRRDGTVIDHSHATKPITKKEAEAVVDSFLAK